MAITLGVLTTKDGQVIPLPTAKDMVDAEPDDEFRKEEEKRYAKCIRKPMTHGVWESEQPVQPHDVVYYGRYEVMTENLKRQGVGMNRGIDYNTAQYRLFEQLFKTPNVWTSTQELAAAVQTKVTSAAAAMTPIRYFLKDEGLLEERPKPGTAAGIELKFLGKSEKPEEEAKLWYAKLIAAKSRAKSMSKGPRQPLVLRKGVNPVPQPKAPYFRNVQIDVASGEAMIRVPLSKLAEVLRVIG